MFAKCFTENENIKEIVCNNERNKYISKDRSKTEEDKNRTKTDTNYRKPKTNLGWYGKELLKKKIYIRHAWNIN